MDTEKAMHRETRSRGDDTARGNLVALVSEKNVPDLSNKRQAMSLHAFLTRLIWLCVLPMVLLAGYLAIEHVTSLQSQRDQHAADLVCNVATAIDRHLDARIAGLRVLATSPLVDDPKRWHELYQEAQGFRESFGSHVVFADPSLQMRFNTRVPFGESLPKLPTPKGHAAAPEALETGRPSVGDLFLGPIAKEPLVAVVVPVLREGRTRFLLLSTIEASQFQRSLDQVALPAGWFLTLLDSKQEVIARRVPPGVTAVPVRPANASVKGCFAAPSSVTRWTVVLDIPHAIYRAPAMTAATTLVVAILIVTLISVLGGRLAARQLGRAVQALAQTTPPPAGRPLIAEIEAVGRMLADATIMREKAEAKRREAESALGHQELLLREMGRIAKIGGWAFDPATGRGTWTEAVAQIHDLDPADETSLAQGLAFYQGDSRAKIEKAVTEAIERAIPYDLELELVTAKGVHKWVHTIGRPVVENGEVVQVRGSFQDITERKQAEEALRRAHERLRRFVDANIVGVAIATPSGAVIEANDYYLQTIGYTREEFERGMIDWRAITPPEWLSADEQAIRELRERGACTPYEKEYVRRDGTRVAVILSDAMLPGPEEQIAAFALDITERKQAEHRLRESEANLRKSQETAKLGSWIYDLAGRITWTDELYRLYGVSPQTFVLTAESFINLIHPNDRDAMQAWIDACMAGKKPGEMEFRALLHDGTVRYISSRGELVHDTEGKPLHMSGTAQDITERKQAEQALRDSEHKFRMIVQNSRDIIYTLSAQGELLFVSPAISPLLGYDAAELIGRPFRSILHPEDVAACEEAFQRSIREGVRIPGFEYRVRHAGGEWRWHNSTGGAVHDARGNLLHFQGIARDITDQRKLEEQLRQAQKMESVGRLAGGVAHDYNNMLSVILGYTELALARVAPTDPLHADLKEIFNAALRSTEITRQLLAFARRQTIAPEVLDLNATVESLLKMLRRLIGEDIDLAWLPGAGLWSVRMDPSQLNQILANLCVNARDAISDVGKITIETKNSTLDEAYCAEHTGFVPGAYVLLAVSDDGCGMDKEVLAHLFEPFFTTKGVGKGTGLGLATVYGIVKQNDGFVNVYSESRQGSTFRIYLPRHAGRAGDAPTVKAETMPMGRGETVLVVEDEEAILTLAQKILERLGYHVLTAHDPSDAIGLAGPNGGAIHLLVTDVVMPEMNGRELAERLRSMHPGLKCLFMSGYTANAIAHHGVLDQGVQFLQKPFSTDDLARKVREALDQP